MSGEGFQSQVLGHLTTLGQRFDAIDRRFEAIDGQLRAVLQRLDDQDREMDVVFSRFDQVDRRLDAVATNILEALKSANDAVRVNTMNTRRIRRLEDRDPGPDAA